MNWSRFSIILTVLLAFTPTMEAANVQNEGPDAGHLASTARAIEDNIDQVDGTIDGAGDVDLYWFYLPTANTVTIGLTSSDYDSNLILFNGLGQGLAGDDDGGGVPSSEISIALTKGIYFVACGENNMAAWDSPSSFAAKIYGNAFIDNDTGVLGSPTTETLYGVATAGGTATGTYSLTFDFFTGPPDGVRTDGRVGNKKNPVTHRIGDNVYNRNGRRQRLDISSSRRKIRSFTSIQNDSSFAGPIKYKLSGLPKRKVRFKAFLLDGGKTNITALMKTRDLFTFYGPGKAKVVLIDATRRKSPPLRVSIKNTATSGVYIDQARTTLNFF